MSVIAPSILLENTSWLALNKPAGYVVNESETAHGNTTVQSWVSKNVVSEISNDTSLRSGIVHRLDKETSGVLLIAKNKNTFYALQEQFASRTTSKEYTSLVHGVLRGNGVIDAPLGRLPWNRKRFGVIPEGRESETRYTVVNKYEKESEKYTLLSLHPQTGRTHQIRVHLKHINHPVVSDPLYVGRKTLRKDREWCSRLFLHATSLEFVDPDTNKKVKVVAALPEDLSNALNSLTLTNE